MGRNSLMIAAVQVSVFVCVESEKVRSRDLNRHLVEAG
jgi:hypothetical protein